VEQAVDLIRPRTDEGAALISSLSEEQLAMPTRPPRARAQNLADTIQLVLIGHYDAHRRDVEQKLRDRGPRSTCSEADFTPAALIELAESAVLPDPRAVSPMVDRPKRLMREFSSYTARVWLFSPRLPCGVSSPVVSCLVPSRSCSLAGS